MTDSPLTRADVLDEFLKRRDAAYALAEIRRWRDECERRDADLAAVRKVEEWIKSNATRRVLVDSLGNVGAFVVGDAKVAAGIDIPALGRALAAQEGANG